MGNILYGCLKGSVQTMEAKEYLENIEKQYDIWQNKKAELNQLFDLATNTTAPLNPDKVQTSSPKDKLGGLIAKKIDHEREVVKAAEAKYFSLRDDCIQRLEILQKSNHQQYLTLHAKYIEFLELKQVAEKIGYSYQRTKEFHAEGIKNFQKILDNPETSYLKILNS